MYYVYSVQSVHKKHTVLFSCISPFSSVIQLTWHSPFRPSADVCVELYNSFRFVKVPPLLCDGSTIILTILVVVVVEKFTNLII